MYSDTGNTTSLVLGFPIRTSSDPRSVGSSPRHIAASHVLHRPLMPRHPPCALKHLQHKNQLLKIEITPQQPTDTSRPAPPPPPPKKGNGPRAHHCRELMLATTIHESNTTPHHQNLGQQHASHHTQWPGNHGLVVSKPNSVLDDPPDTRRRPDRSRRHQGRGFWVRHVHQNRTHYR
jgi:hypothetical protein